MLYYLVYPLKDIFFGFNIFKYITFRAAGAALSAFVLSIALGYWFIPKLKQLKIAETIRNRQSPQLYSLHQHKQGTPTMGGIFILLSVLFSSLLWADIRNTYIILAIISLVWFGLLGLLDDYLKLKRSKSRGLSVGVKLIIQIIFGMFLGIFLFSNPAFDTHLDLPFLKNISVHLGMFYIFFVALVITASSNAVNLTDGLDGLAIGIVISVALTYAILSYICGNIKFASYLFIPYIPTSGELTVFCASVVGAGLGFLWFNCYPASVFMGDVGSLALGGALGTVAVMIKKELLLVIVGGIFAIEALSVILQVGSFKLRGRRIFRIAPLHHHFQFAGWPESKVIVRFWIIAGLLALLTLATLKIR
jgi:phospho-N-acetylmuramoyl-pentapeptide-transferase